MRRYSTNFTRDFNWYLKVRNLFNFDGQLPKDIPYSKTGVSAKEAFFILDSTGKLVPTKHPSTLERVLRTKGSVNLHIKQYAEGRAEGTFPGIEFKQWCTDITAPDWFEKAVEQQKVKLLINKQ